jgi:hypothetical protein
MNDRILRPEKADPLEGWADDWMTSEFESRVTRDRKVFQSFLVSTGDLIDQERRTQVSCIMQHD